VVGSTKGEGGAEAGVGGDPGGGEEAHAVPSHTCLNASFFFRQSRSY
jgi:hypothetical protein